MGGAVHDKEGTYWWQFGEQHLLWNIAQHMRKSDQEVMADLYFQDAQANMQCWFVSVQATSHTKTRCRNSLKIANEHFPYHA